MDRATLNRGFSRHGKRPDIVSASCHICKLVRFTLFASTHEKRKREKEKKGTRHSETAKLLRLSSNSRLLGLLERWFRRWSS